MLESFKGKMLVRRGRDQAGKPVLILAGIFIPSEDIAKYDEKDEMWAVELSVVQAVKFDSPSHLSPAGSVEDFLEGKGMDAKQWVRRP